MCWLPPVISVLARLRQEDCRKFEDSLSYILSSSTACAAKWDCLKHQINKTPNPSTVCVVFAKCWSKKMYYFNRAEALTRLIDRPCFYLADVHCAQGTEAHGLRPWVVEPIRRVQILSSWQTSSMLERWRRLWTKVLRTLWDMEKAFNTRSRWNTPCKTEL